MPVERLDTVVFAHDHAFYRDSRGDYYSRGGQFGPALWRRYLKYTQQLVVAARQRELAAHEDPSRFVRASADGVSFVEVPSVSGALNRFKNRSAARGILRAAIQPADLLVARLPSQVGQHAIAVAQALGKPWCVECVGCTWDAHRSYGSAQARLYAPLAYWEVRSVIRRAPAVQYVTQEFLQRRYPTRGYSVACSDVEVEDYDAHSLTRRLGRIEQRKGGGAAPLRLGLIGSMGHDYKGIDVALRALDAVRSQLPPFELQVVGAGDPTAQRQLAAALGLTQAFIVCGTLPSGQPVRDWLDAVDIYLQPSRQEGLPRALVEAMSRACPALGSNAGGIPELLPEDCLHNVGKYRQLAEQILLACSPDWQKKHAAINHERAALYHPDLLQAKREAFWHHAIALARRNAH